MFFYYCKSMSYSWNFCCGFRYKKYNIYLQYLMCDFFTMGLNTLLNKHVTSLKANWKGTKQKWRFVIVDVTQLVGIFDCILQVMCYRKIEDPLWNLNQGFIPSRYSAVPVRCNTVAFRKWVLDFLIFWESTTFLCLCWTLTFWECITFLYLRVLMLSYTYGCYTNDKSNSPYAVKYFFL